MEFAGVLRQMLRCFLFWLVAHAVKRDKEKVGCMKILKFYPNVVIAGFPKCGTSYLWKQLIGHPALTAAHSNKETCGNEFETLRGPPGKLTINGCIWTLTAFNRHKCFGSPRDTKFIVSVRNPADLAWASYNYFVSSHWDVNYTHRGQLTIPTSEYRSPEMFHEIVTSNGLLKSNFGVVGAVIETQLRKLQHFRDNGLDLLVVSANNMTDSLTRIAVYLGIDDIFPSRNEKVNSQRTVSDRGVNKFSRQSDEDGTYEISGYRPMMEKTREYILNKEMKHCRTLEELYDVSISCVYDKGDR